MFDLIKKHLKIIISLIIGLILFLILISDDKPPENLKKGVIKPIKNNSNNKLNEIAAKNKALKGKLNGRSITGKHKKPDQSGNDKPEPTKGKGQTPQGLEPTKAPVIEPPTEPTDPPPA